MSEHRNDPVVMGVTFCLPGWKEDPPGPDETVEEVAKRAFRMARNDSYTWFVTSDDQRFRIGCGLLAMHYKDTETFDAIQYTLSTLKALSAATQGVPVDFAAVLDESRESLPLLPWYKETADA